MDHPNIAKVFDAGATHTGRPFFVMELVRGVPITRYCDEANLSTAARLKLFIDVCHAIQHAHQKGIIHRDIKPSNILVAQHDDIAVPKVIDFGIAKATQGRLTEATVFTAFAQFIGTPAYMSPEQAEFSGLDVDTRSDIYSLGVLLYELLTGRTPFDPKSLQNAGLDEIRRIIREVEPARPSTRLSTLAIADRATIAKLRGAAPAQLSTQLAGDLDWIVMKSLEKNRTRRYESANAFALDVQRHLGDEPVVARPPSQAYLLQKLIRRHRLAFAAGSAVVVALVLGLGFSTWSLRKEKVARQRAVAAEEEQVQLRAAAERAAQQQTELRVRAEAGEQDARRANANLRRTTYVEEMNLAQQALTDGNLGRATELLDHHRPKPGEEDLRGFEWRYLWGRARSDEEATLGGFSGSYGCVAISPDGQLLASTRGKTIELRSVQTRAVIKILPWTAIPQANPNPGPLKFSPDGQWLILGQTNGLLRWATATWEQAPPLVGLGSAFVFARDGRALVAREGDHLSVWSTESWRKLADLPGQPFPLNAGWPLKYQSMAVSPDGNVVFFGGDETVGIRCWNLSSMTEEAPLKPPFMALIQCLTVSRSGLLAASHWNGRVTIWDIATRQLLQNYQEHKSYVTTVAFSPDDSVLASSSADQTIVLYDLREKTVTRRLVGHRLAIENLVFSADGSSLISASGDDRTLRLWSIGNSREKRSPIESQLALAFADSSRGLVCWSAQDGFNRYDFATGRRTPLNYKPVPVVLPDSWELFRGNTRLSPNLSTLAKIKSGEVEIWNLLSGQKERGLQHDTGRAVTLAFSDDGRHLATLGTTELRLWNTADWSSEVLPVSSTGTVRFVAFSPGGKSLAAVASNTLSVFDVASRASRLQMNTGAVPYCLAISPDGSKVALGMASGAILVFAVEERRQIAALRGHLGYAISLAFSPDGQTLASCSDDHFIRLWNLETRQEILALPGVRSESGSVMFSPDGSWLVANSADAKVQFWPAPSWAEIQAMEKTAKAP